MKSAIVLGIGLLLVLLGFLKKKSRIVKWLIWTYMMILFSFCLSGNPDIENYHFRYTNGLYGLSPGFDALMIIGKSLGLSFMMFKAVMGFLYLFFMQKAVSKFKCNQTLFYALLFFYPFLTCVSQIRNALMAAIVFWALAEFITSKNHSVIKYVICVTAGVLIHPAGFFYYAFAAAKPGFLKSRKRVILCVLLILGVELLFIGNVGYSLISRIIPNQRIAQYFDFANMKEEIDATLNWKGKLLIPIGALIVFTAFKLVYDRYKHLIAGSEGMNQTGCITKEQLNMVYKIMMLCLLLVPLCIYSIPYFRLLKNICPLILIVGLQYVYVSGNKGIRQRIVTEGVITGNHLTRTSRNILLFMSVAILLGVVLSTRSQGYLFEMLDSIFL